MVDIASERMNSIFIIYVYTWIKQHNNIDSGVKSWVQELVALKNTEYGNMVYIALESMDSTYMD